MTDEPDLENVQQIQQPQSKPNSAKKILFNFFEFHGLLLCVI